MSMPRKSPLNVLSRTILTAEVPVFFCTAVSTIILWEVRTIIASMVISLGPISMATATAMAEYTLTKYPET